MKFLHVLLQAKNDLITLEKKLEDIQGKRQVLEKVLKEKNAKANNLQEEVYVLKERLANVQSTHKRELETEKQKVCFARGAAGGFNSLVFIIPGARFSKAPESFRARKAIFRSSVSKNGEVYKLETSRMKGTSLHL